MKSIHLLFLGMIGLLPNTGNGQFNFPWPYYTYFGFEDTLNFSHLSLDTLSNPNNIWQIGSPQKNVFTYCFGQKAIVTDTINSYPINDTSSFVIEHVVCEGFMTNSNMANMEGRYFVNSDSLNDFGKIEFSPDNGISWVLISKDTLLYLPSGGSSQQNWPGYIQGTFTGSNSGFEYFYIDLTDVGYIFNLNFGDTVLFRFTFISDGIFDSMDGLMFDEIEIFDGEFWGISEHVNDSFKIFPNPVGDLIHSEQFEAQIMEFVIYSLDGQKVFSQMNFDDLVPINVSALPTGHYFVKVITKSGFYSFQIFKE